MAKLQPTDSAETISPKTDSVETISPKTDSPQTDVESMSGDEEEIPGFESEGNKGKVKEMAAKINAQTEKVVA